MLIWVGMLVSCGIVRAAGFEGMAGWEGDTFEQGYGFMTLGALFPQGKTNLVLTRLTGSYLYYNYEDTGGEVRVRAPGVAAQVGYRTGGASWSVSVLGGGDLRWERRRFGDAGYGGAVAKGGGMAELEAYLRVGSRLEPSFLINYSGSARYTYGRMLALWQCSNLTWSGPTAWFVGVEGIGQGNYESDALQVGGVVQCTLVRSAVSLSVRGGFKDASRSETTRRKGSYLGAGVYHRF
jgi:Cellulose biosynthesis protein BcsS